MHIGFDNTTGTLQFVFTAEELREAQQLLEMFGGEGDADVDQIIQQVEMWATTMEHKQ
jgi:hypothetical protein